MIAVKFGGSSLADAKQFKKAAAIISADERRRAVVVSAPGKRDKNDVKVTDLLYRCAAAAQEGGDWRAILDLIEARYREIMDGLGVWFPMEKEMAEIAAHIEKVPETEYIASRGEYLNARLMAAYLGYSFIDAADVVLFDENGRFIEDDTYAILATLLSGTENAVMPGFYGADKNGKIHTFSRGGSDVSGAIMARASGASMYENWTDVSGMLFADPRVVPNPPVIRNISYKELRELSYMGASVLHEDAVFPVRKAGIPINIRNTDCPESSGTMITAAHVSSGEGKTVTGIAGKRGFVNIQVEKSAMNASVGFGAALLQIFASHGIPFEHCPTGIDTVSVVVDGAHFKPLEDAILSEIRETLNPDELYVEYGLSMIAVVGHGMVAEKGIAARIFMAIASAGINVRMIDQGSSEMNVIVGVDDSQYEIALRALAAEFR